MMEFGSDVTGMSNFFPDYPLRLYCLNEGEDFTVFHTEIRLLFKAMRYRKDKKNLRLLIENDPQYRSMDADTLEVISIMLNAPKLWENREKYMHMEDNKEEYDMCQAMREWAEEERTAGMRLGIKEGETLLAALMNKLFLDNRMEDAKLAAADENVRKQFYKEYGIAEKNV